VNPLWRAPSRLGKPEAQAAASCFLASFAWDVENDLPAWLSVDDAVDASTDPETALLLGGGVMLHLSEVFGMLHLWVLILAHEKDGTKEIHILSRWWQCWRGRREGEQRWESLNG
jgi:hypothetical protein